MSDIAETSLLDRARSRRLMIATPVYRDTAWQYTKSLVNTCVMLERLGIEHRCHFVIGNSNLPRARNELAAEFLASDCTDLLFVDSDMGWDGASVVRLLASDKPLIGGVGRKRVDKPNSDPAVWCARFIPESVNALNQDAMGAIEVAGVGTGFMKIARDVFVTMVATHPQWKRPALNSMSEDVGRHYYRFFAFADDEHGTGEDFLFCQHWRNLGGTVWIDPEITLSHVGAHDYSGSIAALFAPEDPS